MPVCKRIIKSVLIILCLFGFSASVFSQSMPAMPAMPSMPSMPAIGGSPYRPEVPKFIPPSKSTGTSDASTASKDTTPVLSDASKTPDDLLSSIISSSTKLSASDISSLYNTGLFDKLSGLSGTNISSNNDVLLQQILLSLDDLKTQQKNASAEEKLIYSEQEKDHENFRKRDPSILRFKINGYNIKDSLTSVFFSETEQDGTFLLTADRKYYTGQKTRTETFYLLFRTIKNNGSSTSYEVIPSIVQDSSNPNSFVYRMTQLQGITADKTGNLVVIHSSKGDLNVDMLLDIDNKNR